MPITQSTNFTYVDPFNDLPFYNIDNANMILAVSGDGKSAGWNNITSVNKLNNGSVSNPIITNSSDATTGIYFQSNEVDVSITGVKQLGITSSGINTDRILLNTKGSLTDPAVKFASNMGIYQVSANNAINFTDGTGGSSISILQDGTKNVQFNNITCSSITGACTIGTSTTTPKLILTQTVSNSDPQIQSSTDTAPKCGLNISENNVSIVTEGNVAAIFANGQINIYKPAIIQYEANPITSRTGTITATNTDNKVQKLNFSSADCIYILPTGLNDGARFDLIPFKTSGTNNCYIQVGTGATISLIIGGVKTNQSLAGTNIQLTEGYCYSAIYQSSITTWIVWRSS